MGSPAFNKCSVAEKPSSANKNPFFKDSRGIDLIFNSFVSLTWLGQIFLRFTTFSERIDIDRIYYNAYLFDISNEMINKPQHSQKAKACEY